MYRLDFLFFSLRNLFNWLYFDFFFIFQLHFPLLNCIPNKTTDYDIAQIIQHSCCMCMRSTHSIAPDGCIFAGVKSHTKVHLHTMSWALTDLVAFFLFYRFQKIIRIWSTDIGSCNSRIFTVLVTQFFSCALESSNLCRSCVQLEKFI